MRRGEAGYALLVTLIVVLMVTTAVLLVAAALRLEMEELRRETRRVQVMALLDAGLAQALSHLWSDPDYGGSPPALLNGGSFAIATRKLTGLTVEVTVTAAWGSLIRQVRAVVQIDRDAAPDPPRVVLWEPRV